MSRLMVASVWFEDDQDFSLRPSTGGRAFTMDYIAAKER
jgi:hypothetical protein